MDTSITARYLMICLLFAASWVVVYGNLRLLFMIAVRRRRPRWYTVVAWPLLGLLLIYSAVDAFRIEPVWTQVTNHTLETAKLPPGSRIRIAHLSDLHISEIGQREIRTLNLTASHQPDIIVLTGDYSIVKSRETERMLTQIARRLCRVAPTYAVEGNWDIPADLDALRRGGVRLLDEWVTVRGSRGARIALGQVDWLSRAAVDRPPEKLRPLYKVMLCHMPDKFDSATAAGIDLMLSGHTHGGQVRVPIFGALLPDRILVGEYQAGFYGKGDSLLYVNRGVGMEGGAAPKVRFWCRPEVAVIDIVGKGR